MPFQCRLLILDDDTLVTSPLKSLFMIEGFSDVVFFNEPQKALEYLRENPRDVIVSDFKMPEMNGLQFLTEARKLCPYASMILLTGYADKEDAIKIINEVGLYKYIEKPWDNDELIINIKNAYERSRLVLELEEKNNKLEKYSNHLEDLVKEKAADIVKKNEQLRAVINNCADGILVVSPDGHIKSANPACESLSGLSEMIISTKTVQELLGHTDVASTLMYTHVADMRLRDEYLKAHPRG